MSLSAPCKHLLCFGASAQPCPQHAVTHAADVTVPFSTLTGRCTAPTPMCLYVCSYLWGLLPGVLLFSLSTLFFTTLARLLQPSGRSAAAPKSDVPSVNMCKVQEHVERIQQSHKVVCSGLASG